MVVLVMAIILSIFGVIASHVIYSVERQYENTPRKRWIVVGSTLIVVIVLCLTTLNMQASATINGAKKLAKVAIENPVMDDYYLYHDNNDGTYFIVDCSVFDVFHIFNRVPVDADKAESYIEFAHHIN